MERYIWDIFSWEHPEIIHTGLVNIEGAELTKSKGREKVKSGEYTGWDDPRTWSIQSLEKRGIKPEAIKEFIKDIGLNKQNISIPVESLYAINRRIIDSSSNRYSFIVNPVKLEIENRPGWKEVSVPMHPEKKEKRKVMLGDIYISKEDFDNLKGKDIRLLHLYNIELGEESKVVSIDNKNIPKINWVSDFVLAHVLMPSGMWVSGIVDSGVKDLKKGDIVQFERNFFCRFNGIKKSANIKGVSKSLKSGQDKVYEFWFAHN